MKVGVLGGGSWGTALAKVMADAGHEVRVWCHTAERAEEINRHRENKTYLEGIPLPETLRATHVIAESLASADFIMSVTPSHVLREVMQQAAPFIPFGTPLLCATKGIENDTLMTMSEVLEDVLPVHCHPYLSFLGGPSFALEVARGLPTAVVVAANSEKLARNIQGILSNDFFRVYTSIDVVGVELGGALKNVIAIGAGVAEGLGLGLNARAGLVTRGLAEISRLAVRKGANPLTLSGLAGMGDLVLTCYGALSRNRRVGVELGKGRPLEEVLGAMKMVAEGVKTTRSAYHVSKRYECDMPITSQIFALLYQEKPARQTLKALMSRALKREREPF